MVSASKFGTIEFKRILRDFLYFLLTENREFMKIETPFVKKVNKIGPIYLEATDSLMAIYTKSYDL